MTARIASSEVCPPTDAAYRSRMPPLLYCLQNGSLEGFWFRWVFMSVRVVVIESLSVDTLRRGHFKVAL